ncbi:MAG TPA: acyltransferase [Fimbriimonas sp.]|nr:acyltransferase [Fimbriimonas sp.]
MTADAISLAASFFITLLILGLFWIGLRSERLAKIFPTQSERISSLDGLRGFLALAVVFSHLLSYRSYLSSGRWDFPNHFFEFAPVTAVQMFFCITGFLFWSKAIRSKGKTDVGDFYWRRFLRIYPLYFVMVVISVAVLIWTPYGKPASPAWSDPAKILFPHIPNTEWPHINGRSPFLTLAQSWTLSFEIGFYALFPLVAWVFARSLRTFLLFVPLFVAVLIYSVKAPSMQGFSQCAPFLVGMISAEIVERRFALDFLRGIGGTILVAVGLGVLYVSHTKITDVLIILTFAPIAAGNTIFGVLAWKPCRALGDISYSVYLIHLAVITILLMAWPLDVAHSTTGAFWGFGTTAVLLSVLASLGTYRVFEEPFMRKKSPKNAKRAPGSALISMLVPDGFFTASACAIALQFAFVRSHPRTSVATSPTWTGKPQGVLKTMRQICEGDPLTICH